MSTAASPLTTSATGSLQPDTGDVLGVAQTAAWVASIAVPLVLWFAPLGIEPRAQHAFAVVSFMLLGWMTHILEPAMVGLAGMYLAWALKVVPFEVAFAGFANNTTWFLYGAMLFGSTAAKSGLARRIAFTVMRRVGSTYSRLVLGLIVSDFLLTLIVPSGIARVVLMAAVAIGVIEAFGVGPGSNIGRALFITLTYTATIFDKMVIAGASSITARGLIERIGMGDVLWSQWALAFLPVDIITILLAWRVTVWLYPPEREQPPGGPAFLTAELQRMGPLSGMEKRAAFLLLLATAFWVTDFVHHIPPAMIGLGVGLLAVMPRIGVLGVEDLRKLNYLVIVFVAAALSLGEILRTSGALQVLTTAVFGEVQVLLGPPWITTVVLYWTAFVYHLFLGDEIAMLATSIPVLMQAARTHGVNPLFVGMVWTFGAGGKIFIYQTGVLVVGYSYGYFTPKDMFRMGLALTVIEFFVLLLVLPLWWPLIGITY